MYREPSRAPRRLNPFLFGCLISWMIVLGGGAVGLFIGGCFVLLSHRAGAPSPSQERNRPENDPYPQDCAIIRTYLKKQYGDIEIVSWGRRSLWNNEVLGGRSTIHVRFRQRGQSHVLSATITIGPRDQVENAFVSE